MDANTFNQRIAACRSCHVSDGGNRTLCKQHFAEYKEMNAMRNADFARGRQVRNAGGTLALEKQRKAAMKNAPTTDRLAGCKRLSKTLAELALMYDVTLPPVDSISVKYDAFVKDIDDDMLDYDRFIDSSDPLVRRDQRAAMRNAVIDALANALERDTKKVGRRLADLATVQRAAAQLGKASR